MQYLVKLDPNTYRYTQVDVVRLKREAKALLDFIHTHIDPAHDEQGIWKWVVPLCEGVLQNRIKLPIPVEDRPLKYQIREGLLPRDFEELYAPFLLTITGSPRSRTQEIVINGELYTYVDFEE